MNKVHAKAPAALKDKIAKARITEEKVNFILDHPTWDIEQLHVSTGGLGRAEIRLILEAAKKGLRGIQRTKHD